MAPPSEPTSAATPLVIVSHPRDPGFFYGTGDVDVEDWISLYERVSAHNRWDPTVMLANIGFHLRGSAETWHDTNADGLTSWDNCKAEMIRIFGKPAGRQLAAKKELASRAQTSTEPYVSYILDVLALCHKVDAQMPEQDKVDHILKGIADDAFNLLVCKDCSTVNSILNECKRFEQAKSRRITQRLNRLPNTAATSSCEAPFAPSRPPPSEATPETVTRIVRREIEAMTPVPGHHSIADGNLPAISVIQAVVRDEIASMGLHPVCHVSYSAHHQLPSQSASCSHNDHVQCPSNVRSQRRPPSYRNLAEWRTPDDRPICFNCRRVGHVARYCRSRWSPSAPTSWNDNTIDHAPRRFAPSYQQRPADNPAPSALRFGRSPSPQRRQSRSPQPRRSSSPNNYVRPAPEN